MKTRTLGEIAQYLSAELRGNPDIAVRGLAALETAKPDQLSFLSNVKYAKLLATTQAAAVILAPGQAAECPVAALILTNPYLGFAKVTELFDDAPKAKAGVHATACVHKETRIHSTASIGPYAVIEEGVILEKGAVIGAHCYLGQNSYIGKNTQLHAHVSLYHKVKIGNDCIIHSGTVIGADGFGLANDQGQWIKIRQLGGVIIGNNVEIGANTTIDRGALQHTVIEEGVKIDDQVHIGHNVFVGAYTAIAGCTGISGITKIGKYCAIGGAVAIGGHIEIADRVLITGMTMVTKSVLEAGSYSSGIPIDTNAKWKRNIARFRQLDTMAERLKQLEKRIDGQPSNKD